MSLQASIPLSKATNLTAEADRTLARRYTLLAWACAGLAAVLYSWLAIARYQAYSTGMLDLGNMAQAIASVTRGEPLVFTGRNGNISRLAGHTELIYLAFVPFYKLWSDPRLLVAAQAALFASGALPVYRLASTRLPAPTSLLFALAYLLYPTSVASVLFDLHGDTLALPLLLWMLQALDARAWPRFWICLALSLLCKIYLAAPIFVLGGTLLFARTAPLNLARLDSRRRLGIGICALSLVYVGVMVFGVRPVISSFVDTTIGGVQNRPSGYLRYYYGNFASLDMMSVVERVVSLLVVLGPSALLWWWAPWTTLPAFAILVPAVLSTGPGSSYSWGYHHYAAAVPFIFAGSIDGAYHRVLRLTRPSLRLREASAIGWLIFGMSLLTHIGLNDTPLGLPFWRQEPGAGLDPSGYGRTRRDTLKDRWLATNVPAGVPVAASTFLAPHIADRDVLFLTRYPDEPRAERLRRHLAQVEVVVADALFDYLEKTAGGWAGGIGYDVDAIRMLMQTRGWGLTAAQDGLLRFERNPPAQDVLKQTINLVADASPGHTRFGDGIELVSVATEQLSSRRVRATYRWRALRDFASDEHFVAVSRLSTEVNGRVAHLPTYVLDPTSGWRAGQVREEAIDFDLPIKHTAGRYELHTAWYDTRHPFAASTDERSRIGEVAIVATVLVP